MSDLENLKRQLSYTFLDAYGNFDGADILFDAIVEAAEGRIIELLEGLSYIDEDGHEMIGEFKTDLIARIKGEQK